MTLAGVADAMPTYTQKVTIRAKNEFDRIVIKQLDNFTEEIVRIQLSNFPEILKHLDD